MLPRPAPISPSMGCGVTGLVNAAGPDMALKVFARRSWAVLRAARFPGRRRGLLRPEPAQYWSPMLTRWFGIYLC